LAVGDRIIFEENSKYLGISNGDSGRIVGFGRSRDNCHETLRIVKDNMPSFLGIKIPLEIEIDNRFYKSLAHGFP
jgi:ATP-dependent exoDNAse (exonuclease V) alpha subunit